MRKWCLLLALCLSVLLANPVLAQENTNSKGVISKPVLTQKSAYNHKSEMPKTINPSSTSNQDKKTELTGQKKVSPSTPSSLGTSGVDLAFCIPSDWGDAIIVSKTQGNRYTDTSLSPNDNLYLSYAYANFGTTCAPYATVQSTIYIDGVQKSNRYFTGAIDTNGYVSGEDVSVGQLSAGTHTIKIALDTTNAINETNESNNQYSITVTVQGTASSVDLGFYKPTGWGDQLIATKTQGQRSTDTSLTPDDNVYVSYAYRNYGTTVSPDATILDKIYVDGVATSTRSYKGTIATNEYVTGEDDNIGKLSAGTHTIKVVLDTTNAINETDETNNEYSITVTVQGTASSVDLGFYKPTGWGDKLIATKTQGQRSTDSSLTTDDNLYVSYAYRNYGTTVSPDATILDKIYVDGVATSTRSYKGTIATNEYVTGEDDNIGKLSAGTHTIKVVIDTTNAITETDETNNEYSVTVTVGSGSGTVIHPTSVCLNESSASLGVGDTEQLSATVLPANATNKAVNWTSGDTSIATVSPTGLVTAVGPGNVQITASTVDGNLKAYCSVTVAGSGATVQSLSADPSSLEISIGEMQSITLTATYSDNSTEDVTESATWTSSKPSVATVDSEGSVEGVMAGSATITGSYEGKKVTIPVTVNDENAPQMVDVLVQPDTVNLVTGKTQTVKIFAVYDDDSQVDVTKSVTLVTDDDSVATVTGAVIKGISTGTATVSGTYNDFPIDIPVTVTAPVKSLTVDPTSLSLTTDETSDPLTLTAIFADGDEQDVTEFATWTSSNSRVATVDNSDGVVTVTGGAKGSANITGSYGGKKVTIKVNVTLEMVDLLVPDTVSIVKGKPQIIKIIAVYSDDSQQDVTKYVKLTSDDTSIATVKGATIKGIDVGETMVTGTYNDLPIEIYVTVTPPLKNLEVDTTVLNLSVGDSNFVTLTANYTDGSSEDVTGSATWTSAKPSIATVDPDGTITAIKKGSTTITASYGGKKVTIKVNVTP